MRRVVARTLQQVEGSLTTGGYSMGGRSLGCHQNLNSYVEEKPLYFRVATRPAKVPYKVVTLVCRVVIPEFGWYAPLFTGEKKTIRVSYSHRAPKNAAAILQLGSFSTLARRRCLCRLLPSVKGQPVLFGAAICHPERFFFLISVLPQNRRMGGC